jgi:hypothetical protein
VTLRSLRRLQTVPMDFSQGLPRFVVSPECFMTSKTPLRAMAGLLYRADLTVFASKMLLGPGNDKV